MLKKVLIILFCILIYFLFPKKKENTFAFWTVQLKAPAEDLIQKNIDIFQKKYPDIKIVWVDIPISEIKKRTIASIMGGNPPDLINLNPEYSISLAQKNALEFFDEKDVEMYNEGLVHKLTLDNKIFALPFYATSAVTVLNREKFKNCPHPYHYKDILKLKNCKNPPVFGIALNEGDSFAKILNKFEASSPEEFEEVFSLFKAMQNNNLLLKDTLVISHREVIEKYMASSAGFINAGSNFIFMIKQNAPDVYKKSEILPQLTSNNGRYDVSLMNFVIPKRAKNKELAKEFAKLLLNEENQLALAKRTNVLPANKYALNNPYFKNCSNDLIEKSRCTAANQLNNPVDMDFGYKNKKEIDEVINGSLESLFLENKFNSGELYTKITELAK